MIIPMIGTFHLIEIYHVIKNIIVSCIDCPLTRVEHLIAIGHLIVMVN